MLIGPSPDKRAKVGGPDERQLEPDRHVAEAARRVPSRRRRKVGPRADYALSARTAGRSVGVGRRRALAGTVTTATVLPIMSKNSTEYPSSAVPGTACRSTTVPTS